MTWPGSSVELHDALHILSIALHSPPAYARQSIVGNCGELVASVHCLNSTSIRVAHIQGSQLGSHRLQGWPRGCPNLRQEFAHPGRSCPSICSGSRSTCSPVCTTFRNRSSQIPICNSIMEDSDGRKAAIQKLQLVRRFATQDREPCTVLPGLHIGSCLVCFT